MGDRYAFRLAERPGQAIAESRQVLSYAPQDDGFRLIALDETEGWG